MFFVLDPSSSDSDSDTDSVMRKPLRIPFTKKTNLEFGFGIENIVFIISFAKKEN